MGGVLVIAASALVGAGMVHGGARTVSVAPGGIVRWLGRGTKRCELAGRAWAPLHDACIFPVDLGTAPGPLWLSRRREGRTERVAVRVSRYPYPTQRLTIADESKVVLSVADLARAEREQAELGRLWNRDTTARFSLPFFPPLGTPMKGGRFGVRRIINGQPRSPHTGVDFPARLGAPVYSAAAGVVVLADDLFFSGESVVIDHGDGLLTMYFHLSHIGVERGQRVRRGEALGAVGATGRATGPHLHFGVRWHGARIDPEPLLVGLDAVPRIGR
jgi:murein DD-endopeptidase MepM/ murein hydrolase activator NlpD